MLWTLTRQTVGCRSEARKAPHRFAKETFPGTPPVVSSSSNQNHGEPARRWRSCPVTIGIIAVRYNLVIAISLAGLVYVAAGILQVTAGVLLAPGDVIRFEHRLKDEAGS